MSSNWDDLKPREPEAAPRANKPAYWGVDLDPARRPGVPMEHHLPRPLPNAQPPERQQGRSAVPRHGRLNKTMPPVFSSALPLKGLSGAVRRFAYSYPDHSPSHWMLKLLGDRIEAWGHRIRKVAPVAVPFAVGAFAIRALRGAR